MDTFAQRLRKQSLLFLPLLLGAMMFGTGCGSTGSINSKISWPRNQSVYVSQGSEVDSFPISSSLATSGNVAPLTALTSSFDDPHHTAFDSTGRMYETDYDNDTVDIFAAGATGNAAPTVTLVLPIAPNGIAIDASNNVYLSDTSGNSIYVLPAVAVTATGTIAPAPTYGILGANTALNKPNGIALNSTATKLWVANEGSNNVLCFTLPAAGTIGAQNLTPSATITNQAFGTVHSVALDSSGSVYVTDSSSSSSINGNSNPNAINAIFVFSSSANGAATPTATITGSNTELGYLNGISLDSKNNIYVGNGDSSGSEILIFPAGANGNVAPAAIIGGSNTPFEDNIHGVTVGPALEI